DKSLAKPGAEEPFVPRKLTIRVPGSTSNLGPGFDSLGLALSIYSKITFELLEKADLDTPIVNFKGTIAQSLPNAQDNLVYNVLRSQWENKPELLRRTRITIESDIPLGRGLGSSGTAILSTIWASYVLSDILVDSQRLLAEATKLEGHPDNLAASLHGGLVVSSASPDLRKIVTQRVKWPEDWQTIIVVPRYTL